jgi:tetratricopeptide (TPR) repeat protein
VPKVLERLERESGLLRYRELADVPEPQRLSQALTQTQERYAATPESERVYPVGEAIRELARLSGAFVSMAGSLMARDVLESLPSLEPLRPLSPAIQLVADLVSACKDWIGGRNRAHRGYADILARLAQPDRAGLDEAQHARTVLGLHYSTGLIKATMGLDSAEQHAQVLESDREVRVNAWRVRQILKLAQGDVAEARTCARRAELLQLQEGLPPRYPNTSANFEFAACVVGEDLLGAKSALDRVAVLAAHFPGWRPMLIYGQSRYLQMQGDLQAALDRIVANLHLVPPGEHAYFGAFAAAHVDLLSRLGRADEALAHAQRYLELFEREELHDRDHFFYVIVAQAHARAGDFARALEIMDTVLQIGARPGRSGLALGTLYEARAQIAIWMGDSAAFERFAGLCGDELAKAHNPQLSARFTRLLEEARTRDVAPESLHPEIVDLVSGAATDPEYETVESRMRECVDDGDRARCALTMLLQRTDSFTGYLYGLRGGRLELLAGLPDRSPEPGLHTWLEAATADELADSEATATSEEHGSGSITADNASYTDADGRTFEALWLVTYDADNQRRTAGVLAFHVQPGPRSLPDRGLIARIAAQL